MQFYIHLHAMSSTQSWIISVYCRQASQSRTVGFLVQWTQLSPLPPPWWQPSWSLPPNFHLVTWSVLDLIGRRRITCEEQRKRHACKNAQTLYKECGITYTWTKACMHKSTSCNCTLQHKLMMYDCNNTCMHILDRWKNVYSILAYETLRKGYGKRKKGEKI